MQSCGFLLIWSAILKCFKNIAFDWLGVYVPKRHNVQWGTNLHLCISHFPFSQTSRLLVLRHHRQILFTDFYLKPCATTSAIPWTPQSQANSSRRQGHVLNVRPSFQTSYFLHIITCELYPNRRLVDLSPRHLLLSWWSLPTRP